MHYGQSVFFEFRDLFIFCIIFYHTYESLVRIIVFLGGYNIKKEPFQLSQLPSKLRFSANCLFFRQYFSLGYYPSIYQQPEEVYVLNI